jgi:hypothetical protein
MLLKFRSTMTPKKLSMNLKRTNQNFAGNHQPSIGESAMVKETPAATAPSHESDNGTAFVLTSTPKPDAGSQYE